MKTAVTMKLLPIAIFAASLTLQASAEDLTVAQMSDMFKLYDVPEDDAPDCQPDSIDAYICPKDEKIPCGPIPKIEEHCKGLLGDEVAKYDGVEADKGMNAFT